MVHQELHIFPVGSNEITTPERGAKILTLLFLGQSKERLIHISRAVFAVHACENLVAEFETLLRSQPLKKTLLVFFSCKLMVSFH